MSVFKLKDEKIKAAHFTRKRSFLNVIVEALGREDEKEWREMIPFSDSMRMFEGWRGDTINNDGIKGEEVISMIQ